MLFRHSQSGEIRNAPVWVAKRFKEFEGVNLDSVDERLRISIESLNGLNSNIPAPGLKDVDHITQEEQEDEGMRFSA